MLRPGSRFPILLHRHQIAIDFSLKISLEVRSRDIKPEESTNNFQVLDYIGWDSCCLLMLSVLQNDEDRIDLSIHHAPPGSLSIEPSQFNVSKSLKLKTWSRISTNLKLSLKTSKVRGTKNTRDKYLEFLSSRPSDRQARKVVSATDRRRGDVPRMPITWSETGEDWDEDLKSAFYN